MFSPFSRELEEFNMAVGQYMRLLKAQSRHVKQVDVYDSPKVQKAFSDKERELKARGSDGSQIWVFHGTKEKTLSGITKGDLIKNKYGKIVSKKRSLLSKKNNYIKGWTTAVQKARKALGLKGFVAIKKGSALYKKAKELYQ